MNFLTLGIAAEQSGGDLSDHPSLNRWRNRIVGYVEDFPVDELIANPNNWRIHPDYQRQALEHSLDSVGWVDTVLINRTTAYVIDGHERAALALYREEPTVPALIVELTEDEEAFILSTLDPISALAQTDQAKLKELTDQIETSNIAIRAMFDSLLERDRAAIGGGSNGDHAPSEDRAAALNEVWEIQSGQVWELRSKKSDGYHRLMCGDCRDDQALPYLINLKSARPDAVITDPPYGVNIVGRNSTAGNFPGVMTSRLTATPIEGDSDPFDPKHLLNLADKLVLWGGNHYADKLPIGSKWLVWDKKNGAFQESDLGDCELAWTNLEAIASRLFHHTWMGMIRSGEGENSLRLHPTQKPVALMEWCIEQAGLKAGQVVFDPYCGAGSTIIACENTGMLGIGMDIEPKYIAATLQRLNDMGLVPERLR